MKHTYLIALASLGAISCSGGDQGADVSAAATPAPPSSYAIGHPVDAQRLAALDIDVNPSGVGLPTGSGTAAQGAPIYAQKCSGCHGAAGEGVPTSAPPGPKIVGREPRDGFPFGTDPKFVKTVGNYWPYATTLYDYIHRAMPITTPGSLQPNEVYALVAFILAENEIVAKDAVIDAKALAAVKMPAHDKFVMDDRTGGKVLK